MGLEITQTYVVLQITEDILHNIYIHWSAILLQIRFPLGGFDGGEAITVKRPVNDNLFFASHCG